MNGHRENQLKNMLSIKTFLSKCLDCTFVDGSQCKYLKNVDKIEAFGLWNCVVLEGFCMWKVCIKNNKILEMLNFNVLLDFVGIFWKMGFLIRKDSREVGIVSRLEKKIYPESHSKVTTATNKNYIFWASEMAQQINVGGGPAC